jgi:hypothetical protein
VRRVFSSYSELLCASVLVKSGLENEITAVGDLLH